MPRYYDNFPLSNDSEACFLTTAKQSVTNGDFLMIKKKSERLRFSDLGLAYLLKSSMRLYFNILQYISIYFNIFQT
jgi:hypothetical protein